MSPTIFNKFIDEVIIQWQDILIQDFKIGNTVLNRIVFAGDPAVFSELQVGLQRVVNRLESIANGFIMRILTMKTKTTAFQGKNHIRCQTVIDNKTIEQVSSFKYLGFNVSRCLKEDINIKVNKFQRMCGMIRRTPRQNLCKAQN
jgi:hypothetical protein